MTDTTEKPRRRRWWIAGAIALVVVVAAGAVAFSFHGHGIERFAEKRIDRMLDKVDASDGQRAEVTGIVREAVADMKELRGLFQESRQTLLDTLGAETVDRQALEELRLANLQTVDQASRRLVTALADVADVLTPEQRRELVRHMQRHERP
ncbi:MAG: periplasmic heavy metal sensor [bacterium]|nr:periplasmic heavy metal sensor [bacterium]